MAVVRHDETDEIATSRRLVERAFAASFESLQVDYIRLRSSVTLVVLREQSSQAPPSGVSYLVWGQPIGVRGVATDEEIRVATTASIGPRDLLGRFAFVEVPPQGAVRAFMGAELAHVLKCARGTKREVVATSGVLATLLAAVVPRVAIERVGEFLAFDCVLGESELLEGVELLPEATVVEVAATGTTSREYWSVEDRFRVGAEPEPEHLWDRLVDNATRIFGVDGYADSQWLGLTSGRDSTLLAAAAEAAGARPTCFTFGDNDYWDVHGARAVCDDLGWRHHNVWRTATVPISLNKVTNYAAWTDGLETARNLYGAPWSPTFEHKTFVSGHGGEIGRAFYWKEAQAPELVAGTLARSAGAIVPGKWTAITAERTQSEIDRYSWLAPASRLDALYARSRTRNWTGRALRRTNFAGGVMGFGDPGTVGILMNVPDAAKRNASFFDSAIDLDRRRLQSQAKAAAGRQWELRTASAKHRSRLVSIVTDRDSRDALRLGARCFANDSLLRETFGPGWCAQLLRRASHRSDTYARRALWNAIAVEGLHRLCARLR